MPRKHSNVGYEYRNVYTRPFIIMFVFLYNTVDNTLWSQHFADRNLPDDITPMAMYLRYQDDCFDGYSVLSECNSLQFCRWFFRTQEKLTSRRGLSCAVLQTSSHTATVVIENIQYHIIYKYMYLFYI